MTDQVQHREFDAGGYPTQATLDTIRHWRGDGRSLAAFVIAAWRYPGRAALGRRWLRLSTGGWSGDEDIIAELQHTVFWTICWESSTRGGHYRFDLSRAVYAPAGDPLGSAAGAKP